MEEERRRRKSLKLETDDNAQQDSVRLPLYVHLMLYLFFQVLRKSWVFLVCFPFYLKELRSKIILFSIVVMFDIVYKMEYTSVQPKNHT